MAQRRMFSMKIVDTDRFLDMPQSAQLLYFHLSMRADDEGFVPNPKKIMRAMGNNDDDLKILFAKNFLIGFETGIVVIRDWRIHNYIAKDRFTETHCKDERSQLVTDENGSYTKCIQITDNMKTQVRLGKVRLGKERKGEENEELYHKNEFFSVSKNSHIKYLDAFPNLDIDIQYKRMISWLESNPKKRKSDYPRFINSWLNRAEKDRLEKSEKQEDLTELEMICKS